VIGPRIEGWVRLGQARWFSPPPAGMKLGHAAGEIFQRRRRRLSPWRASDNLWGLDRIFNMKADEVRAALATLPPDGLHEFLFHPRTRSCPDTRCLLELQPLSFS
jgi:hypothetical protein